MHVSSVVRLCCMVSAFGAAVAVVAQMQGPQVFTMRSCLLSTTVSMPLVFSFCWSALLSLLLLDISRRPHNQALVLHQDVHKPHGLSLLY